jgi:hypothetical protein
VPLLHVQIQQTLKRHEGTSYTAATVRRRNDLTAQAANRSFMGVHDHLRWSGRIPCAASILLYTVLDVSAPVRLQRLGKPCLL